MRYIRHLRPCLPDQIRGCKLYLQAPLSGAYIDMVELFGCMVDICREMFFHADGRAAAANITGEREQLLDRDHFTAFVAGDFGGFLQIDLVGSGDDTDEITVFIAMQD